MVKLNKSLLNKGELCRGCVTAKPGLTEDQLNELRDFIEELDLIPLGALPSEVWPIVYEYQKEVYNEKTPFNPIEKPFFDNLNKRLRERSKNRQTNSDEEFKLFNI